MKNRAAFVRCDAKAVFCWTGSHERSRRQLLAKQCLKLDAVLSYELPLEQVVAREKK